MTEQELLTQNIFSRNKPKLTARQRQEIYKKYRSGISQIKLAKDYEVSRGTIQNSIYKYRIPTGLREVYWCGAKKKEWAIEAKKKMLEISNKYNTPSGRKKEQWNIDKKN